MIGANGRTCAGMRLFLPFLPFHLAEMAQYSLSNCPMIA